MTAAFATLVLAFVGLTGLLGACAEVSPTAVDAGLVTRSIAVGGAPEVGETLTARISPDLDRNIESWGPH